MIIAIIIVFLFSIWSSMILYFFIDTPVNPNENNQQTTQNNIDQAKINEIIDQLKQWNLSWVNLSWLDLEWAEFIQSWNNIIISWAKNLSWNLIENSLPNENNKNTEPTPWNWLQNINISGTGWNE